MRVEVSRQGTCLGNCMNTIHVGLVNVPLDNAKAYVAAYTDSVSAEAKKPYAYHAYDFLDTGSKPDELNDGDLLAPALLNSAPSVSAFFRLRAMKDDLQQALSPDAPIARMTSQEIEEHVAPVYTVLDTDRVTHSGYGLSGTTLSKVLHRKRPQSLCLHDRWVRLAYLGTEGVPKVKRRSWAQYMTLVSQTMARDIQSQERHFVELHRAVVGEPVSDLRLLDILVWSSRGGSRP